MKAPIRLSATAKQEWQLLSREIEFQPSDYSTLLAYVEAFARYRLTSDAVEREGLTVDYLVFNLSGIQVSTRRARNPNLVTMKDERAAMLRAAYLLGLTELTDDEDNNYAAKIKRRRKTAKVQDTRDRLISWRDSWDEEAFIEAVHAAIGTGVTVDTILSQTLWQHSGYFFDVRYETKAELGAAILQRGHSSLANWRAKHGYVDGNGVEHPPTVQGQR
jgi:phage terminase small subunit